MSKVAVIMGSKSDLGVVKPAVNVLKDFGVQVEVRVISAHRTPEEAHEFSVNAIKNGFEVIICAAGKAAHLGGVIAAGTTLPVIGLPVKTDMMGGLDSLLS
ncbi:MAG: AIR carboxylase family protein, partial [Clostridia bacterium]|nr:AIR carboxylase family protein [Clostridia bacterium]